jgi:hypothetical protein
MFNVRGSQALRLGLLVLPVVAILMGELQTARMIRAEYYRRSSPGADLPKEMDRLVAQFDDALPPYGYIGYIDPHHSWLNANATRQFYLTQYALAPRVLVYNTLPNYVIYFSHKEEPITPEAVPPDLRILQKVRLDLAVLRREK